MITIARVDSSTVFGVSRFKAAWTSTEEDAEDEEEESREKSNRPLAEVSAVSLHGSPDLETK